MPKESVRPPSNPASVSLGENPVNDFQAREYARESSPSTLAVLNELTENARDNATEVRLVVEVDSHKDEAGQHLIFPKKIICEDNGIGLSHKDFLTRFCGAFADSVAHHEVQKAGRNGVGTKTYSSIAETVLVRTTSGRPTDGFDDDTFTQEIQKRLPAGMKLPKDGEPDVLWREYWFQTHTRGALPEQWSPSTPHEMGTRVELLNLREGTSFWWEALIERMSFSREWLQNSSNSLVIELTGNVPAGLKKKIQVKPWTFTSREWLTEAKGTSDKPLTIWDPTEGDKGVVDPLDVTVGVIEFDFKVAGRDPSGKMQLEKPALLLEICGALPYAPQLDGVLSSRTIPLLTFLGLDHVSSIGSFCTAVCGYARINALGLKEMLRNNKTTLATGPGADVVEKVRSYLKVLLGKLHRAWYNATRASDDAVTRDAVTEAVTEINLALKGGNASPMALGDITKQKAKGKHRPQPPIRRHRWECGSCGVRWTAEAGFTPTVCAETRAGEGQGRGCGSQNIGLAKNQPRIGDCDLRLELLADEKIPSIFQYDRINEDLEQPVVRVNIGGPRYIELRGTGSMSGQAQKRLKQYLVDVSLFAIADFFAKAKETDLGQELGELYYQRMLRSTGIKQFEAQKKKILDNTSAVAESESLTKA